MNEYSSIHAREYMTMYENKNHVMVVLANIVNKTQNVVFSCGRKKIRYRRFYLDWRQLLSANNKQPFLFQQTNKYRASEFNEPDILTC